MSPLERNFKGRVKFNTGRYPQYISAAIIVLREMNMEIVQTEKWNLEKITIRTFARCIANVQVDEGFYSALSSVGLTRMREISHWFREDSSFAGYPICGIIRAIIDQDVLKIFRDDRVDIKVPKRVLVTRKIGPSRADTIAKIVTEGIKNIGRDPKRELYIPRVIRLTKDWQLNSVQPVMKSEVDAVVSDGSKRLVAAFAVVDRAGGQIISSPIVGRPTSQRAECYGILAAAMNSKKVGADPKFILDTISKHKEGFFKGSKILKVSNRSLIKKIAYLTDLREVTLKWVRGHQDHRMEEEFRMNQAADAAAREAAAQYTPPLLQECWEWADDYAILWKGDLYEGDVRKKVYNIRINRMIEELGSSKAGSAFSRIGCWEEKASKKDIIKHNALLFKMSTDTLPVHSVMEKRWPALFSHLKCPMCGDGKETLEHLMNKCESTQVDRAQIWEEVTAYLCTATNESQESIARKNIRWIHGTAQQSSQWYLGKIPEKVGKWIKKKSSGLFTLETIWNGIRGAILDGVQNIWKVRCDRNMEQRYTWLELKRVEEEWRWLSSWEEVDTTEEEIWLEEITNPEVDELILEENVL